MSLKAARCRALVRGLVPLALLLVPPAASAVTCGVSTAGLPFGNYDVFSATPLTLTASVTITCTRQSSDATPVAVSIVTALSTGSSASFTNRTMRNGINILNYNVFTSNTYVTPWGDGSATSATQSASMSLSKASPTLARTLTGWGRVPALQDVVAGPYTDTLTVTATF